MVASKYAKPRCPYPILNFELFRSFAEQDIGVSNMRELNKYSIIISVADSGLEGSQAKQYEDRVEACILQCTSTVVGRAVIAKIRAHGRVVVIPYTNRFAEKFKTGNLNAMSLSTDSSIEFNPLVRKYFDPVFARSTNIVCFSPMRYD